MKSFKFLGALALLTGAMLVATSCNKKDNEPASGQFPTLNEILGSWIFDEIPEGWQGIPGVDLDVEDVYVCLEERGGIYMGALQNYITGQYSYSAADGTLTITVRQLPVDVPTSVATLTKGPGADQLTISVPLAGSTTITKVCDKNYLLGECKDEPVDPDDPEDPEDPETHIPTGVEIRGSWYIEGDVPGLLADFEDLIAEIREGGQIIVSNYQMEFEGDYTYQEEDGWMTVEFPMEGSNTPWYVSFSVKMYDLSGELVCTGEYGDQEFEFYLVPVIEEDDEDEDEEGDEE